MQKSPFGDFCNIRCWARSIIASLLHGQFCTHTHKNIVSEDGFSCNLGTTELVFAWYNTHPAL